jgi:hypothetical protein
MFTLAERLLLLALHDEEGSVVWRSSVALPYGLTGAVLQELALRGNVAYRENKIVVIDSTPTGDEILDEALLLMGREKKSRDAKHWVNRLRGDLKDLKEICLDRLVAKGVLRRERRKLLWVFPVDRFPTENPRAEADVRHQIRNIVLEGETPDEESVALIGLMKACDLINEVFVKPERRDAKRTIKKITSSEEIAKSVSGAVADVTAAIAAATTAAVAGAAASSTRGS